MAAAQTSSLSRRDFPASMVEDLFSSPYFKGGEGFGPKRARQWRELIRRLGIHAGLLQWRGKLERRAGSEEDARSLWELVSRLGAELGRPEGSWAALAGRAGDILESFLGLPSAASERESEAWEHLRATLESFRVFDRLASSASWEDFLDAFERKLKARSFEEPGLRGGRGRDAMGARGESFRVLFLIGLKEGRFPRQVVEDPLLREAARAALRHPGGYWISRKTSGYEEERLLFYLMASSAQEKLYCVYPRSDEEGRAEVPSLYLRELCRAAGLSMGEEETNRRVPRQPREKLKAWEPELLSPKEVSLRLAFEGGEASDYLERVGRDGRLLKLACARLPDFFSYGKPGELDGRSGPPEEYLRRLREQGISPSALESFARCPFQFFADRVLGLGRGEEAAEKGEFAAWARGKIYHAVLERFYSGLGESFWRDEAAEVSKPLDEAIQAAFAEFDWRELGVYPLLWLAAKKTMTARLREFVAWDLAQIRASGLRPAWFERALEGPAPAKLPRALEGLRLRGIVDRVDIDADAKRYQVVDYKTHWGGQKPASLVAKGEMHQLPVYAELAGRALGGGARFMGASLYVLEDSPGTTGAEPRRIYAEEDWSRDRKGFFERVAGELEEIAQGRYPIRPDDGEFGYCRWCDFSAMCRKNHGPSRRRALDAEA